MSEHGTKLRASGAELAKFCNAELEAQKAELKALKAKLEALKAEREALKAENNKLSAQILEIEADQLSSLDVAWMKDCDFDLIAYCEYLWKVGPDKGALMLLSVPYCSITASMEKPERNDTRAI